MYVLQVAARSVQISLDEALLEEVDRQPECRERRRSAFIRQAITLYLDLKRREAIDEAYTRAYSGRADEVWDELSDLMGTQSWPDE